MSNKEILTIDNNNIDEVEEDVFTKRPDNIDYNVEFVKGQYWIREGQALAFILDANKHAVIFQYKVQIDSPDFATFDFEAGQELMSTEFFRKYLKDRRAYQVFPDSRMTQLAFNTYNSKLREGLIPKRLFLPSTDLEVEELVSLERYTITKKIIPPPISLRNKKALHWLKVGSSGLQQTCKMWDPNIDNYVLPDGSIDVTATVGFVNEYNCLAAVIEEQDTSETFTNLVDRILTLLKNKGLLFVNTSLRNKLLEFEVAQLVDEEGKIPFHDITLTIDNDLTIYLSYKQVIKSKIIIFNLVNKEFINANADIKYINNDMLEIA